MSNIDFIYYKLCNKYGFDNIAMKKEIKSHYDMKPNDEGIFEVDGDFKESLGGIYFINIKSKEKIDLQKEKLEGTFNR